MTFSVATAIDAYARTLEKTWAHDRSASIGASEIGQCARRVWYLKNDTPQDEGYVDAWGPKVRGNIYEDVLFSPAMAQLTNGATAHWYGAFQRTFASGFLSATPDCLITTDDGECFLIECKSIDPRVDLRKEKDEHAYQVQIQMGLVREFTNHAPDHAILAYLDASFPDQITEFRVDFDQKIYDGARLRAMHIMSAGDAIEVRPEGMIAGGKECGYCPWSSRCRGDAAAAHPKDKGGLSEEDGAAMGELIDEYDRLKAEADETTASLGLTKQEIKELLRGSNTRWAEAGGRKINWQSRKGKVSVDTKAMEADGVDLEPYRREGDPFDVLTIK